MIQIHLLCIGAQEMVQPKWHYFSPFSSQGVIYDAFAKAYTYSICVCVFVCEKKKPTFKM